MPLFRVFRIFRVVVVVRQLKAQGPARIADELLVNRAAATFFTTIFLVIVVLEVSGMLILDAEGGIAGANIRTPSDALWWGYVTITTVGYGDQFPVTLSGRIIGIFLLTAGVALFSVFTGFIANAFLAPRRRPMQRLRRDPRGGPLAELDEIRRLVVEQDERSRELQARLDALERALVARRDGVDAGALASASETPVERGPDAGAMTQRISAGILLFRRGVPGGLEVLLGHPGGPFFAGRDLGHWSIPKGEVALGEDLYVEARREFEEETGHAPPAPRRPRRSTSAPSSRRAGRSSTAGRWRATWTRPPRSATPSRCAGRQSSVRSPPSPRSTASPGSPPRRRAAT